MGMVVTLFAAVLIAAAVLALAALVLWELRREAKWLFCQLGWWCGARLSGPRARSR